MKKNILFKLWKFPRLSETFILAQIITAIKCGYKVNILVEELLEINETTHGKLIEKYNLTDKVIIEDYGIPNRKFYRILKALLLIIINISNLKYLKAFIEQHRKFELRHIYIFHFFRKLKNFDIVHVQYGTNGKPLDILKKTGSFPPKLIVSFHGHDVYFPINGIIENNGYYDDLFKYADKLIANTTYLKNLLIELEAPAWKIETIPVTVNINFFKPVKLEINTSETIRIITVGRLEIFKGQHLGIECISKLVKNGYNVHYTIVGKGSQEEVLKNLIKECSLNNYITLTGRKSQEDIKELLQNHDIFLMTSITDPNYGVESQGLVTAEAQACGLPVIGFDSGGVKYTVMDGETGFIVPEFDVAAMTKRIEELIDNVKLRQEMGKEAVIYVENHFSQNKINDIWCKTYNELSK
jgi:colanic acid/amylovoran biosynthesis glycosyltransferase